MGQRIAVRVITDAGLRRSNGEYDADCGDGGEVCEQTNDMAGGERELHDNPVSMALLTAIEDDR